MNVAKDNHNISSLKRKSSFDEENNYENRYKIILEALLTRINNEEDNEQIFLEFNGILLSKIKYNEIIPISLNVEGSCIMSLSVFWVLYIKFKLSKIENLDERNKTFLKLFNLATDFQIENKIALVDYYLNYIEQNFTQIEIVKKINLNGIKIVDNLHEITRQHYKYLINNLNFFNSIISTTKKKKLSNNKSEAEEKSFLSKSNSCYSKNSSNKKFQPNIEYPSKDLVNHLNKNSTPTSRDISNVTINLEGLFSQTILEEKFDDDPNNFEIIKCEYFNFVLNSEEKLSKSLKNLKITNDQNFELNKIIKKFSYVKDNSFFINNKEKKRITFLNNYKK